MLHADKRPDFIALHLLAGKASQHAILVQSAGFADFGQQPEDGVLGDIGNAAGRCDTFAFDQHGDDLRAFFDAYTWTAIDADTKLVPCWHVGDRGSVAAHHFISDLASRLANRIQLTTDGHKVYVNAVEESFGRDVDYAMLVKLYGDSDHAKEASRRYSPSGFTGSEKIKIVGNPATKDILRRACQPDYAHEHAPLHAPDQCIQQEARKPYARCQPALHAL